MNRFDAILRRLLALCAQEDALQAVLMIGSQCRATQKADKYSDLDLIVACDTPEALLDRDEWVNAIGQPQYSFVEDTLAGQRERRILFKGSLDVDFIVVTPRFLCSALETGRFDELFARGCRVLYTSGALSGMAPPATAPPQRPAPMAGSFKNLVNDFYYHTVWAQKKLLRGELWTAKRCVDSYLKSRLLQMIELYEVCLHGASYDVWHDGRLLEHWAEPDIVEELGLCFAHYEAKDIAAALARTTALFTRLARVCAQKYGFSTGVPQVDSL